MPQARNSLRFRKSAWLYRREIWLLILLALLLSACQDDMSNQPRYEPLEESLFFEDRQSARPILPDTVPAGSLEQDFSFYDGRTEQGDFLAEFPGEITPALLERGQERYDIFCSPCHGLSGYGQGMIVQRGFPPPPSFHDDRVRQLPVGYIFDVITNGYGEMYPFAYLVPPEDRWAIIAYIRALQLSQYTLAEELTPEELLQVQSND